LLLGIAPESIMSLPTLPYENRIFGTEQSCNRFRSPTWTLMRCERG
jgi:hypothetical protein